MKINTNVLGYMIEMAAISIYDKTFKYLLQNQLFDCLEFGM